MPDDVTWHNGLTHEWWTNIEWTSISQNDGIRKAFEREIYLKIYLGGVEPKLRKEVRKHPTIIDTSKLKETITCLRSGPTFWGITSGFIQKRTKLKWTKKSEPSMNTSCLTGWLLKP